MWVGGGVAGSQPMSTAVHMSPNKLWRSNSIFKLWFQFSMKQKQKKLKQQKHYWKKMYVSLVCLIRWNSTRTGSSMHGLRWSDSGCWLRSGGSRRQDWISRNTILLGEPSSLRNYFKPSPSLCLFPFFALSLYPSPVLIAIKKWNDKQMSSIIICLRLFVLPKANVSQVPSSHLCCFILYNIFIIWKMFSKDCAVKASETACRNVTKIWFGNTIKRNINPY